MRPIHVETRSARRGCGETHWSCVLAVGTFVVLASWSIATQRHGAAASSNSNSRAAEPRAWGDGVIADSLVALGIRRNCPPSLTIRCVPKKTTLHSHHHDIYFAINWIYSNNRIQVVIIVIILLVIRPQGPIKQRTRHMIQEAQLVLG